VKEEQRLRWKQIPEYNIWYLEKQLTEAGVETKSWVQYLVLKNTAKLRLRWKRSLQCNILCLEKQLTEA